MPILKCTKCGNDYATKDLHRINYSGEILCNNCYTDDIKKEEDYYDFCCANEYRYEELVTEESEDLSNQKFYK